jgi:molybdenum cofactor biosynthesis enzyme
MGSKLTHLDARNRPAMVDVAAKAVTLRTAMAEARLRRSLIRNAIKTDTAANNVPTPMA